MTKTNTRAAATFKDIKQASVIAVCVIADDDASKATGHACGCDCTTCCLVRTESGRAQGGW